MEIINLNYKPDRKYVEVMNELCGFKNIYFDLFQNIYGDKTHQIFKFSI